MVDLQRDRDALPPAVRVAVDKVLLGSATHYAVQAALGHVHRPSAALLRYIDRSLDAVIAWDSAQAPRVLLQLVGIRRGLFADAAPYRSTPRPGDAASATAERLAA